VPNHHRVSVCAMTAESTNSVKMQLAAAIAQGTAVAEWAVAHDVPDRTAYRWAKEPEVRAEIESIRRRALDQAIGLMAQNAVWAVSGIVELGDSAESESVRLSALRAIMSDFVSISNFAGLEVRMAEIEEQLHERNRNAT
jgi:hypothetical protein